ncbi:MAG: hypothetical protein R3C11_09680 [Planctomycetaceae bacterium]
MLVATFTAAGLSMVAPPNVPPFNIMAATREVFRGGQSNFQGAPHRLRQYFSFQFQQRRPTVFRGVESHAMRLTFGSFPVDQVAGAPRAVSCIFNGSKYVAANTRNSLKK